MAETAVQVFRDNDLPAKTAINLSHPALMAIKDKEDTNMKNDTSCNLSLISSSSKDDALGELPGAIKSGSTINITRSKTAGSGVVYRGTDPFHENYDWVLAWADKPDFLNLVYAIIQKPPPTYGDDEWNAIFAQVDMSGPSIVTEPYLGYVAKANIRNDPCQQSVVDARIYKTDLSSSRSRP